MASNADAEDAAMPDATTDAAVDTYDEFEQEMIAAGKLLLILLEREEPFFF